MRGANHLLDPQTILCNALSENILSQLRIEINSNQKM